MGALQDGSLLAACVASGLTAGLCFTFAAFVMRALDRLGEPAAIRAMQAINAAILRSIAMPVWIAPLPLGGLATLLAEERWLPAASTLLYALGALLITRGGNIPLNEGLDGVDPEATDAAEAWRRYRIDWGRWNLLRTLMISLATAGFAWALRG